MNTTSSPFAKAKHLTLFVLLLLIVACSSETSKKKQIQTIEEMEKVLFSDDETASVPASKRKEMELLRSSYRTFLQEFPTDTVAARYIYNWAMMDADFFKQYEASALLLERFQREFPQHELAAKALFLQAFTYAEYVKDFTKAELGYKAFLQRYPNHDLVPSIQFELQNLGKSPEELLNLKMNSANPEDGTKAAKKEN